MAHERVCPKCGGFALLDDAQHIYVHRRDGRPASLGILWGLVLVGGSVVVTGIVLFLNNPAHASAYLALIVIGDVAVISTVVAAVLLRAVWWRRASLHRYTCAQCHYEWDWQA